MRATIEVGFTVTVVIDNLSNSENSTIRDLKERARDQAVPLIKAAVDDAVKRGAVTAPALGTVRAIVNHPSATRVLVEG